MVLFIAGMPVQLDQVGSVENAEIRPGAALVDAQEVVECLERGAVDVERGRQQLAHGRPPAGFVDRFGVSGPEEEIIGQTTGG